MHQRGTITIGRDRVGFGVEESARVVKKINPEISQTVPLLPNIGKFSQEDGYIVV
jgi:hypothetical protein